MKIRKHAMENGWLVENEGVLGLWSGFDIEAVLGLPLVKGIRISRHNFKLGKVGLAALPSYEKSLAKDPEFIGMGLYMSVDGQNWVPFSHSPVTVDKNTTIKLDTEAGVITYIMGDDLHVVKYDGRTTIKLPCAGLRCAASNEAGDWIVVGRDLRKSQGGWNRKVVAWVLDHSTGDWRPFTPEVSRVQDMLIRTWFGTDQLFDLDVSATPKLFLGDSGGWDEWSFDSIFVECQYGRYRPFRTGVGVVNGIGRNVDGTPYLTTGVGEYMSWNGRRFIGRGWRKRLSEFFHVLPEDRIYIRLEVSGNRVRGICRKTDVDRSIEVHPFSSDDFGDTWTRHVLKQAHDGWKVLCPFIRS